MTEQITNVKKLIIISGFLLFGYNVLHIYEVAAFEDGFFFLALNFL
jgi:hypothetical protein